jgi:hypothetical protein
MKLPRRQFPHLAAGAAALPAVSNIARAQAYPARPVFVPYIELFEGVSRDLPIISIIVGPHPFQDKQDPRHPSSHCGSHPVA